MHVPILNTFTAHAHRSCMRLLVSVKPAANQIMVQTTGPNKTSAWVKFWKDTKHKEYLPTNTYSTAHI